MDNFGTFMKKGEDELHREINRAFFKILEENNLYLCLEKCVFEQPEIDFLGIYIKNREISINPSKIARIKEYNEKLSSMFEV